MVFLFAVRCLARLFGKFASSIFQVASHHRPGRPYQFSNRFFGRNCNFVLAVLNAMLGHDLLTLRNVDSSLIAVRQESYCAESYRR